jgi:hypothetical protein
MREFKDSITGKDRDGDSEDDADEQRPALQQPAAEPTHDQTVRATAEAEPERERTPQS